MSSLFDQQKSETREFQNKLLSTVSVLLADYVTRKEHSIDNSLQAFLKNFDERAQVMTSLRDSIDTTTKDVSQRLTSFEQDTVQKKMTLIGELPTLSLTLQLIITRWHEENVRDHVRHLQN